PAPAEGGMLKRHWWLYWRLYWQPRGGNLPPVSVKMPDGTIEQRKAVDLPLIRRERSERWQGRGSRRPRSCDGDGGAAASPLRLSLEHSPGHSVRARWHPNAGFL